MLRLKTERPRPVVNVEPEEARPVVNVEPEEARPVVKVEPEEARPVVKVEPEEARPVVQVEPEEARHFGFWSLLALIDIFFLVLETNRAMSNCLSKACMTLGWDLGLEEC